MQSAEELRTADVIKVSSSAPTSSVSKLIPPNHVETRDNIIKSIMCETGINDIVEVHQILRTMLNEKQVSELGYSALIKMTNTSDTPEEDDSYKIRQQKIQDIIVNTKDYTTVEGKILDVLREEQKEFGNGINQHSEPDYRGRRKSTTTKKQTHKDKGEQKLK